MLPLPRVFAGTVTALAAPRRLFPIAVVVVPLLALQGSLSRDSMALPVGMLMCAAFLFVAPTLWRYFFPLHRPRGSWLLGAAAYGAVGVALMFGIGRGLPRLIGMGSSPGPGFNPSWLAAAETARAPTLWRVRSYCRSALPRPTTTRVEGFPVASRSLGGTRKSSALARRGP